MPLYSITVRAGMLDAAAKRALAQAVTTIHCDMANVPREWVHIVFDECGPDEAFTGGEPATTVALTVIIRAGRSPDYKRTLLHRLDAALKESTGASDAEIVIGILEVPASQAMEMGKIMDDV